MRLLRASAVAIAVALLTSVVHGAPQAAAQADADKEGSRRRDHGPWLEGQGRHRRRKQAGTRDYRLEVRSRRRRLPPDHRPGGDLLEPRQHGEGRLHGQGDLQGSRSESYTIRIRTACSSAATSWTATSRRFVYCVAYRDGTYLIRQFNGPTATTVARNDAARGGQQGDRARSRSDATKSGGPSRATGPNASSTARPSRGSTSRARRRGQARVDRRRLRHSRQPQLRRHRQRLRHGEIGVSGRGGSRTAPASAGGV